MAFKKLLKGLGGFIAGGPIGGILGATGSLDGVVDAGQDIVDNITGESGREAAQNAANTQREAGLAAIEEARLAREQGREDQQPFTKFGAGALPALSQFITPEGQASYLSQNNPFFKAALENLNKQTLNNAAVRGRLGAGDTKQSFFNNFQAAALPYLNFQGNTLFNAANLGQAAASGQAANSLQSGQIIGNNLTGIGNAQAAGIVGAANAKTDALGNIIKGVTSIVGGF